MLHESLDLVINTAASLHQSPHHGEGCNDDMRHFFNLDNVIWFNLAERLRLNDTGRDTEALSKFDFENRFSPPDISRYSLDQNRTIDSAFLFHNTPITQDMYDLTGLPDTVIKSTGIKEVDMYEAEKALLQKYFRVVLVFIYSEFCGYCTAVWRLLEILRRLNDDIRILSVSVDHNDVYKTVLRTNSVPTLATNNPKNRTHILKWYVSNKLTLNDLKKFLKSAHSIIPIVKVRERNKDHVYGAPCLAAYPEPPPKFYMTDNGYVSDTDSLLGLLDTTFDHIFDTNYISDNFPETISFEINSKRKDAILMNPKTKLKVKVGIDGRLDQNREEPNLNCASSKRLLETLSHTTLDTSSFDSNLLYSILSEFYDHRCLINDVDFWDSLGKQCFDILNNVVPGRSREGHQVPPIKPCEYLRVVHALHIYYSEPVLEVSLVITSYVFTRYDIPGDIYQEVFDDVRLLRTNLVNQNVLSELYEIFYCYNPHLEMGYWFRRLCSIKCQISCHIAMTRLR